MGDSPSSLPRDATYSSLLPLILEVKGLLRGNFKRGDACIGACAWVTRNNNLYLPLSLCLFAPRSIVFSYFAVNLYLLSFLILFCLE